MKAVSLTNQKLWPMSIFQVKFSDRPTNQQLAIHYANELSIPGHKNSFHGLYYYKALPYISCKRHFNILKCDYIVSEDSLTLQTK